MSAAEIATLLAALGVGGMLPKLIEGVVKWLSGHQDAEQVRVRAMLEDRDRAEERAREANQWARTLAEYAGQLRRMIINDTNLNAADLPPWPRREKD